MKRNIICTILALFMILPLASCGKKQPTDDGPSDTQITTQSNTESSGGDSTNSGEIYMNDGLVYASKGNGTCDVVAIQADPQSTELNITVPAYSPRGERVVSCDLSNAAVPTIFLKETFDAIANEMKTALKGVDGGDFNYRKFLAFFVLYDINDPGLTNLGKENMLKRYPIAKERAIYVIDNATPSEYMFILDMLSKYTTNPFDRWYTTDRIVLNLHKDFLSCIPMNAEASLVVENGVESVCCNSFISLTDVSIPNSVTRISVYAFKDCVGLTTIELPGDVTQIGSSAFSGCTGLTAIDLPDGITEIGSSAFSGCINLTNVDLPSGLKCIRSFAFRNCSSLTDITIPDSVVVVDSNAFFECDNLYQIEDGVVYVDQWAIDEESYDEILSIRSGTVGIGGRAFSGCTYLTSVSIPDSVRSIGSSAFSNCKNLTNIAIPVGVIYIGGDAFRDCSSLIDITIPNGVASIDSSAFSDCSSLVSINIPGSVTSIGFGAFSGCSSLTNISISYGVVSIADAAFSGCIGLESISIPDSVIEIGYTTFEGCSNLIQIENGVSYVDRWAIKCEVNVETVSLRSDTVSIGSYAFSHCSSLSNITIPNSVTSIGSNAFQRCSSLTSLVIPDSVTRIGENAFSFCDALIQVVDGVSYVDKWAIACDVSLTPLVLRDDTIGISDYAFARGWISFDGVLPVDPLKCVKIPNSVEHIGAGVFRGCDQLEELIYDGTLAEWEAVEKHSEWDIGTGDYTITYLK